MDRTEIHAGDNLHFNIRCASEQDLEITVFREEHLLLHQNSTLLPGDIPFDIETKNAPAGKYFILVTGNGIHVEKEFTMK
jgi:hypothetical protein